VTSERNAYPSRLQRLAEIATECEELQDGVGSQIADGPNVDQVAHAVRSLAVIVRDLALASGGDLA
jgi:hypothetical protein